MATIDRAKTCTECLSEPRRVRKGKIFPLCDLCRVIVTTKKWKTRQLKRLLIEGRLVQFNIGDGWRAGYLLKLRETRADVQPIGAVGRIPDVVAVNIVDLKKEEGIGKLWENVQDFYKANQARKPVVLVADQNSAALGAEVTRYWNERNGVKPRPVVVHEPTPEPKPAEQKPVAQKPGKTAEKKESKPRGAAITVGGVYGLWTVKAVLGHSRFTAELAGGGETRTMYAAELRAEVKLRD